MKQGIKTMNIHAANEIKKSVKPILDIIKTARSQPGGLKLDDYVRILKITTTSLESVVNQANKAITAAEYAHQNRPVDLINKAVVRLSMISNNILHEEALSKGLITAHQMKKTELEKQGFSDDEIGSIVPYPQTGIDAHQSKISELEAEAKGIEEFLNDGPRYNAALLSKSDLSNLMQETTIPNDKPPIKLITDGAFPKHPNDAKSS
jgi:hypothetical protein